MPSPLSPPICCLAVSPALSPEAHHPDQVFCWRCKKPVPKPWWQGRLLGQAGQVTWPLTQKGPALDLLFSCPSLKGLGNFIFQLAYWQEDLKGWWTLCDDVSCSLYPVLIQLLGCPRMQSECKFQKMQHEHKINVFCVSRPAEGLERPHPLFQPELVSKQEEGPGALREPTHPFLTGVSLLYISQVIELTVKTQRERKAQELTLVPFQSFLTTREYRQVLCILIVQYSSRVSFVQCFPCW